MTAPLVDSLQLQLKGVPPLVRLAGKIVLGSELFHQKRELGYEGGGGWQAFREEQKSGNRPRWTEFCIQQAGITEVMAAHYLQCGEAVKTRLRFSKKPEKAELLQEMSVRPSTLTSSQRSALVEKIARLGLTAGDTQSYLKKEFKAAQPPGRGTHAQSVIPHPTDPAEELRELGLRLLPVVKEEHARRRIAELVQLARAMSRQDLSTGETDMAIRMARQMVAPNEVQHQAMMLRMASKVFGKIKGGRLP
jgi:hypothetical protein